MRIFLSIDLNDDIIKELARLQSAIKSNLAMADRLILVRPDSMHLTLRFFADIEEKKLTEVRDALRALDFKGFSLEPDKLNYFTKQNGAPRVVFLSFKKSEGLTTLNKEISEKLLSLGFEKEMVKSHATLFRVKYLRDKFRLIEILKHVKVNPILLDVKSMELYESNLTPSGPVYTLVERFELG